MDKSKKQQGKQKPKKTEEQRKHYLKPVDEIIARIKWDATLSKELDQFIIGYLDRFLGIQETTIQEFEEGALIPFHRIYYLKLYGNVIWDREKRLDLVSSGQVYQYSKHTGNTPTPTTTQTQDIFEQPTVDSTTTTTTTPTTEEPKEEDSGTGVIFSTHKKRKIYQPYHPNDILEKWMLQHNTRKLALSDPTHVSQRGGYYHIDKKLESEFYDMWAKSLISQEKFYMEEFRTPLFRLYVDVDIKMTLDQPFNMIEAGWLQIIVQHAQEFFALMPSAENSQSQVIDSTCTVVIECHSPWTDANTTTAVYKSGYRIYFTSIFVNFEVLEMFAKTTARKLKQCFGQPLYEGQPENWQITDIIDVDSCAHDKARMFGTVKFRRGNEIPRRYSFAGFYNSNGELDKYRTELLKKNIKTLLKFTSVRFEQNAEQQEVPDNALVIKGVVYQKKDQHFYMTKVVLLE